MDNLVTIRFIPLLTQHILTIITIIGYLLLFLFFFEFVINMNCICNITN